MPIERIAMTRTHFAEGQVLFREGDSPDSVFRLLSGSVDIRQTIESDGDALVERRTKPTPPVAPPSSPPLTREQAMDRRAAADFEQSTASTRAGNFRGREWISDGAPPPSGKRRALTRFWLD